MALFAFGCADKAPEVPAPAVDAAPVVVAPKLDAETPRFVIVPGKIVVEAEAAPDAAPAPARPKRRARRAPRRPKAKRVASSNRTAAAATGTIRRHWGEVERCYGAIALKDPSVRGRIVMQWTLGADGMPTATAVLKDTLSDPRVSRCIKAKARAWRFPAPSGGVSVITYPFDLRVQ